ncbi:MAG: PDZ domain-containing protein, partial [Hyphomicrobiaceae bacterium]
IISPTGGSIGIGFAIPSDTAMNVVDQLRRFGETRRGWLGVNLQSVGDDIAETLGVPANTGALVAAVTPDGPASKGGLKPGDLIVRFDGKPEATMRSLPRLVAQTPIGKSVEVEVLRDARPVRVNVEIGRLIDDAPEVSAAASETSPSEQSPAAIRELLGLTLSPITDELRQKHKIDKKVVGVVVTEVDPSSAAASKSIKPGDVIVEVAQDQVVLPDDVARSIEKVKKSGRKAVLLRIEGAKGELRFVAVPIG